MSNLTTALIPSSPGVYFFKGPKRQILYIGKAANLKKRLKSYLENSPRDPRISKMLETAANLDWQETGSEIEALILESQLIKKHRPLFNIMLRDDKQYFYVGFTKKTFPRLFLTHQPALSGKSAIRPTLDPRLVAREFSSGCMADLPKVSFIGPFTEGSSLKSTLKLLRHIFPYCTCKQKHYRYCLNYHIGNCLGFCCLKTQTFQDDRMQKFEYQKNIRAVKDILNGKRASVLKNLEKEMRLLAKQMGNFVPIDKVDRGSSISNKIQDFDEIGKKAIELRHKTDQLQRVFENAKVIKELVSRSKVLEKMQKALGLSNLPQRIEGYDISNIQGQFATGAMIVFNNGYPDKNEYRKFKIRLSTLAFAKGFGKAKGDVAMLKEMLSRRFNHPEWPFPDLILVDGGKAQLNAADDVISNFQFLISKQFRSPKFKIPIIALAKDNRHRGHHIFLSIPSFAKAMADKEKDPLALQDFPLAVKNLILQIDSEAHRFAISYYRKLHRQTI